MEDILANTHISGSLWEPDGEDHQTYKGGEHRFHKTPFFGGTQTKKKSTFHLASTSTFLVIAFQ